MAKTRRSSARAVALVAVLVAVTLLNTFSQGRLNLQALRGFSQEHHLYYVESLVADGLSTMRRRDGEVSHGTVGTAAAAIPALPNSQPFSACLIVMDDNHRLVEWIAYHYYALNLRNLIIMMDPSSNESPQDVLDRWQQNHASLGLRAEVWTDKTTFQRWQVKLLERRPNMTARVAYRRHNRRQELFYKTCAAYLAAQRNATWTAFIDTDEYLTINTEQAIPTTSLASRPLQLGNVSQAGHVQVYFDYLRHAAHYKLTDPTLELAHHLDKACVILPRAHYGTTESSRAEITQGVPPYLDAERLDTTRWRHRSHANDFELPGKALVDVSQLPPRDTVHTSFGNAHKPFESCRQSDAIVNYTLPLGIHHYVGSWEQFTYRSDAREGGDLRNRTVWEKKGAGSWMVSDEVRPWLAGFVGQMNHNVSLVQELLAGAGLPPANHHGLLVQE
jgi:hypothetical protein